MIGANNSVLSRVREKQPNVFNVGCICHLADLCASGGVKKLSLPIDEFLFDVHFHFDRRYIIIAIIILWTFLKVVHVFLRLLFFAGL